MKKYFVLLVPFLFVMSIAVAQDPPSGKTLASTLSVYAFPQKGQAADQQSKDEASCYDWGVQNSGNDPFELQKQSASQEEQTVQAKASAQQSKRGTGLRGAAGGAAAGAVGGRLKGRRSVKKATSQAEQQGRAQQQGTQEQINNFKKAFSVCLEGKGYLVKY